MIVDGHVHVTKGGGWLRGGAEPANPSALLSAMDAAGVERAVLIGLQNHTPNFLVRRLARRHPDRFWAFRYVNPVREDTAAVLDDLGGFTGIKLHPRLDRYRVAEVIPFLQQLSGHENLVLLLDCWFSEEDPIGLVDEMVKFVAEQDSRPIIMAHGGGFRFARLMPLLEKENVYVDFSYTLDAFDRYNKATLSREFVATALSYAPDRVIFGSDFPEVGIQRSLDLVRERLNDCGCRDEFFARIMGGTIHDLMIDYESRGS